MLNLHIVETRDADRGQYAVTIGHRHTTFCRLYRVMDGESFIIGWLSEMKRTGYLHEITGAQVQALIEVLDSGETVPMEILPAGIVRPT